MTALRRAEPRDADAITDVLIRSRRAAAARIPALVHSDEEVRGWVGAVVLTEHEVWLAEEDGRARGVLVLDRDRVDQLYVDPDFTGRGLGTRLLELAKSRRPAGLQLWTFASNLGAQRFYLRHGFAEAERTDGSGNEEKAPDIRFTWSGGPRIELVTGDITVQTVDAVVNAANSSLLGGGGVDGAIHRKGGPAILEECRGLRASGYGRGLKVGRAVATTAGRLPARWVIHTVGPVFSADEDRSPLLRSCYTASLAVAVELGARSVAFPLISSGVYRWPKQDAIAQALTALRSGPAAVEVIRLVLFDEPTRRIAEGLLHPSRG